MGESVTYKGVAMGRKDIRRLYDGRGRAAESKVIAGATIFARLVLDLDVFFHPRALCSLGRGCPPRHASSGGSSSPPSLLLLAAASSGGSASLSLLAPLSAQARHQADHQGAAAPSSSLFNPVLDLPSTVREDEEGEEQEQERQDDEFEQELLAHRRHLLSQHNHQQVVFAGKPAAWAAVAVVGPHCAHSA